MPTDQNQATDEKPLEVTCQEVAAALASDHPPLLIDCREPHEHDYVNLPQARLVPMAEIPATLESLRSSLDECPGQDLVIYCHHGMRSAQTAVWLRQHGLAEAQSMAGGIDRWAEEIDSSLNRY